MILVLLMYASFAASFTVGKEALFYGPPFFLTALRFSLAGFLILAYWSGYRKYEYRISKEDLGLYAQVIVFHVMAAYLLEFWALQYVSSIKACLLFNLSPIITAFLAWGILKDRITPKQWVGLLIGCAGFIPLLSTQEPVEQVGGWASAFSLPEFALVGAIVSSCYGWLVVKKLMARGYDSLFSNGIGMFFGGLLSFPVAFLVEGVPTFKPAYQSVFTSLVGATGAGISIFLINMLLLILFSNLVGYTMYGHLLKRYSTTFLAFMGLTTPLFASVFGVVFLSESITFSFILSAIIVSIGLGMYYKEEFKEQASV